MGSRFQNVEGVFHLEATPWLEDPVEETSPLVTRELLVAS